MISWGRALGVVALTSACGCSDDTERPPMVDPGLTQPPPAVGGSEGNDGGITPGTTDAGTTGGPTDVEGDVTVLLDDDFTVAQELAGASAIVWGETTDGGFVSDVYDSATNEPFSLSGVTTDLPWFAAAPMSGADASQCAIVRSTVAADGTVMAHLALRDIALEVFAGLARGDVPQSDRAQIFLFFEDEQGDPLSGVTIAPLADATVAYARAGGTWSDTETETDGSGKAAILNADARALPPGSRSVEFTFGGSTLAGDVKTASDCVTVAIFVATSS